MLTLLFSSDWVAGRNAVLDMVAKDVKNQVPGCIVMVPELISHDMERRLCLVAGNTSSRFAEVLSFSRLARRVKETLGCSTPECLDNGGRILAMAAAALQLHGQLKAYASVETKPEFLTALVEAIDEFKCCCISAEDIRRASKKTEGSLAQKLEEIALLMDAYEAVCHRGKRDPRDQMTWLLEELESSDFAATHRFYIDGFPDFTRQHMNILEHLIASETHLVISMNCDKPDSKEPAFEKAGNTAAQIIRCAKQLGVQVQCRFLDPVSSSAHAISSRLFGGAIINGEFVSDLTTYRVESIYDECAVTADKIMELVSTGVRYREIGIACGNIENYKSTMSMLFHRCGIPCYLSGTEDILDKSVMNTVLMALDAVLGGFDQRDVFRYIKSLLSPLSLSECDKIENYAILWSISGNRWLHEWTNHPYELGGKWTQSANRDLEQLNASRKKIIDPLVRLRQGIVDAADLKQQVLALYHFLEDISFSQMLSDLSDSLDNNGDNRSAQIANQAWEILMNALEQLHDVLGGTKWDAETFVRFFKLLLSQYDVGTIPTVLDSVTVGSFGAMRCQETKYLFVLGALEGTMPKYSGSNGILTDQDRGNLRKLGVPVNGGALDNIQVDYAEIYGVFNGVENKICVSCPAGQPSYVFRRLTEMAGGEQHPEHYLGAALTNPLEAAAYLARWDGKSVADRLELGTQYKQVLHHKEHCLGSVARENITGLYGDKLTLSASQIDKQADCRMRYFLHYGLRLKERKSATVDPSEFGTYVHAVLEDTAKEVMERGGFRKLSLNEVMQIAAAHSDKYASERFDQLDSERLAYLFRRNVQELMLVVQELWQEMQTSDFVPVGFEVAFGDDEQDTMPSICVSGKTMEAYLGGFVDRVDLWSETGNNYFRVVDYKTGKKDFDYCDVFNGLGLQMLLYLFALESGGKSLLGSNPRSAGVQYFPARVPLVSLDGISDTEQIIKERDEAWIRKGLILNDDGVIHAMENTDELKRLSCKRNKDGALTGDLANREQFKLLRKYVFDLVGSIVDDIASGNIEPNPYTRGDNHNACAFCPFGSICHKAYVEGRRNYKSMNAKKFWEEVEKEVARNG